MKLPQLFFLLSAISLFSISLVSGSSCIMNGLWRGSSSPTPNKPSFDMQKFNWDLLHCNADVYEWAIMIQAHCLNDGECEAVWDDCSEYCDSFLPNDFFYASCQSICLAKEQFNFEVEQMRIFNNQFQCIERCENTIKSCEDDEACS